MGAMVFYRSQMWRSTSRGGCYRREHALRAKEPDLAAVWSHGVGGFPFRHPRTSSKVDQSDATAVGVRQPPQLDPSGDSGEGA